MFSAHVLTKNGKKTLLDHLEPNFPNVIAHHVTVEFGVHASHPKPPQSKVVVYGYVSDDSLEAAVVKVNGKMFRPDGKRYHITLSLDRSLGRKPVDSNALLSHVKYTPIEPFEVETKPDIQ
jgi:hypothetical protein